MAYTPPTGLKKPMSDEARQRIADAVRATAARKRAEAGLPPIGEPNAPAPDYIERPLELVKMRDQNFSPDLFIPMKTEKPVDFLFTDDGGLPKACNFMVVGDPGVGKTTVTLDILADLNLAGYKTLFISAEMSRIDLYGYVQRFPKFGEVDILFTGEYCDSNPRTILDQALNVGYDVVLIDSFTELQEDIKEALRMTTIGSEKLIIDTMLAHNMAENESKTHTTFLIINQVTKGGLFVGSNKIKHAVTGMLEIRRDQKSGGSYLMFDKNRRGSVNKRMFYNLSAEGDVEYDLRRFNNDEDARDALVQERAILEGEDKSFDDMFGTNRHPTDDDTEVETAI
jgi:KaiC/GvpD/RAD55 family RecA-like ATPase